MILPADGIVIENKGQLLADESSMTGESDELKKATLEECREEANRADEITELNAHEYPHPIVLSGSKVYIYIYIYICL